MGNVVPKLTDVPDEYLPHTKIKILKIILSSLPLDQTDSLRFKCKMCALALEPKRVFVLAGPSANTVSTLDLALKAFKKTLVSHNLPAAAQSF